MPAIARITTFGKNYHRDRDRLIECLRDRLPFYMASTTGGENVNPDAMSMGRLPDECHDDARASQYVVWSYETPIAWWHANLGWVIPDVRYSRTTSVHLSSIRLAIRNI